MEEKINKKPLITTIVMAIVIIMFMSIQMKNPKQMNDVKKYETQYNTNMLTMQDNCIEIFKIILSKNADWSNLPLSSNFLKKYNSKVGILNGDNFDKLYTYNYSNNKEKCEVIINIGYGYRYDDYYFKYFLNEKNELDDVQLIKTEVTQYAEGLTPTIASEPSYINKNNYKNAITHLSTPYMYEFDGVETTENFKEKYGNGFGDESEFIDINGIIAIEKLSNWDDKVVYFYKRGTHIDGTEDYERFYICNFTLDDEGRVDDIKIVDISEAEIDKLLGIK